MERPRIFRWGNIRDNPQWEGLYHHNSGKWRLELTVPVQDAKAIPDGTSTVTLAVLDNAGNPVSSSQNFEIITHTSPHVTLNTPFGDGYLNAVEATNNQVLSGSTGVSGIGQTVTVNFGGKSYTATVDAQGNWKANIPSNDFANLNDGQQAITVTASDAVGNSDVLNGSAQIDKTLPQITIDLSRAIISLTPQRLRARSL